jgi:hypothetical protein
MKKSIFLFFAAILCAMSVNAKDIYADMSSAPSWYADAYIHYWDGSSDKYVKLEETGISKLLKATINDNYQGWRVCRYVDGGRHNDCTWISDKNVNKFIVNSNGNGGSSTTIIGLVTGGHIYFDNLETKWTGNIQFVVGHDSYSRTYEMTQISNTHLWYVNLTDKDYHTWGDAKYYGFIASGSKFGDGSWNSSNLKNATSYTKAYTSTYSLNEGAIYYCKMSATANGSTFSIDYKGSKDDITKYAAKQAVKVRVTRNDAYANATGTWPITISTKGTYLSENGQSGNSDISGSKSDDGNQYDAVVTGKIIHTYSNLSDDYKFEGWGTADEPTSADASYEYNIRANTTVYAFLTKKYPVNFSADANGSVTATVDEQALTSGNKVVGGTEVTLTATANDGYKFVNWTKGGEQVSTEATYSLTVTENVDLVANFVKVVDVNLVDAGDLGATLTGAGEYTESSSVTVTASHTDPDWVFAYWKHQGGEIASYDAEYTFTLGAEDVVLEAYFAMGGMESNMNDLVIDTDTYADTYMAVLTGSDASNGIEAMLAVSENIAGDLYRLAAAEVSFSGSSLDFVSGTVTIDMDAYTAIADVIVSLGGELMAIRMNMSATAAPVDVMVADATVTYSDNDGALRFNGTDAYSSDAVYVELSGFEYNGVGSNTLSVAQISMFENSTAFAFADEVVVTIESDGTVSVEGTYTSWADGSVYNVFIYGALPTYNLTLASNVDDATLTGAGTYYPTQEVTVTATEELTGWLFENWTNEEDEMVSTDATYTFRIGYDLELIANYTATTTPTTPDYTRTVATGEWGTICLPYASSSVTGATLYEVSSLVYGEGLWLDQLVDGAQLEAGKPYIFQATATEIAVTYTGEEVGAPVEGANGLTGTFTEITAGGLTGNYIIAENKVWVAGTGATLSANRAYIDASLVPTTAQAQLPGRRRVCMGENAATGLDNITNGENTVIKTIENGQLIIIRNGEKFNAQGVRL